MTRQFERYDASLPAIQWQALEAYTPPGGPPEEALLLCEIKGRHKIMSGHWADSDGEGFQPAFQGWFVWNGCGFNPPPGKLLAWAALPPAWWVWPLP